MQVVHLHVPMGWLQEWEKDSEWTGEQALRFASALTDELLETVDEEIHIVYDVVADDRYGREPTAGSLDIEDYMIEAAFKRTLEEEGI